MNARPGEFNSNHQGELKLPAVVHCESVDSGCRYLLQVPAELVWFDGHFPGDPILPAVVQLGWVIHFAQDLGFDAARFSGFSRLKFRSVITPCNDLRLTLTATDDRLNFSYESHAELHSKGTVLFGRPE